VTERIDTEMGPIQGHILFRRSRSQFSEFLLETEKKKKNAVNPVKEIS
jgi:hypothetical protein